MRRITHRRPLKLLHMADIHLGAEPDQDKPWGVGGGKLRWQAFAQAIEAAIRQQVDLVLISGDLFHRQPLKRELKEVNGLLGALGKIPVVLMAGNHDYISRNSMYRGFSWNENIRMFSGETPEVISFPELDTWVYGLSYEHREIRERKYDGILPKDTEGYHILLAHGGDEKHIPFSQKMLMGAGFDYVAMGHIHQPAQLVENAMIMAGSLQPLDATELGARGYWLAELTDQGSHTSFHSIKGREYVPVELALDGSLSNYQIQEEAVHRLAQLEDYQVARLILTGWYDPDLPPDQDALAELDSVAAVELRCRPKWNLTELKLQYEDQPIGEYLLKMEELIQNGESGSLAQRALELGLQALLETAGQM